MNNQSDNKDLRVLSAKQVNVMRGYIIKINHLILCILATVISCAQEQSPDRAAKAIESNEPVLRAEYREAGLTYGSVVFFRIFKQSNEFEVWVKSDSIYRLFKTYHICYYSGSLGTKTREGDGQAPEGFYEITRSSMNPLSSYHLSFNIGYPNRYERRKGYTGSAIMVHGYCVSIGCYAMGDDQIEEIWTIMSKAFQSGQSVIQLHIFPFRMSAENMLVHSDHGWNSFWSNLQEGYLYFETNRIPPKVSLANGKYCFR